MRLPMLLPLRTNVADTSHMKVNPNRDLSSPATVSRVTEKSVPAPAAAPDFAASTQLADKLAATPEVRAESVARAKALIADPNYPDAKAIHAIAKKLAGKIQR